MNMLMKEASPGDPKSGVPLLGLGVMARLWDVGDALAEELTPSSILERGAGISQDKDEERAC